VIRPLAKGKKKNPKPIARARRRREVLPRREKTGPKPSTSVTNLKRTKKLWKRGSDPYRKKYKEKRKRSFP